MAVKKKTNAKKGLTKTKIVKKPVAKKAVNKTTKKKVVVKKVNATKSSVVKKAAYFGKLSNQKTVKPVVSKTKKAITKVLVSKAKKAVVKKTKVKVVVKKNKKIVVTSLAVKAKKTVAKKPTPTNTKKSKAIKNNAPTKVVAIKKTVEVAAVSVAKNTAKVEDNGGAEKRVKVGIKTKKQLIALPPQPIIEVSDFDKLKVKTVLISQPKPEGEKNPYFDLASKYNLDQTFRQFIKIEGLPVKDFRAQRIDILEHKAVILTSRMAVDHYFRMCNEMRVIVPETMKYFCINEATAYYLQKYIQYRKRKIFFGHQTIQDLVDVIRKNREERFLLPAADVHKEKICDFLDAINIKYTKAVMYRTVSANLSDIKNLNEYDVLTFFTPAGIRSLKHNFPNFKQGNTRIACFGPTTANELKKHGYRLDIYAPNPKSPSMSGALEEYFKESNKR